MVQHEHTLLLHSTGDRIDYDQQHKALEFTKVRNLLHHELKFILEGGNHKFVRMLEHIFRVSVVLD